jgi:hypothetical protein
MLIGQLAGKNIERAEVYSDIVLVAFTDGSTIDIREADGALRLLLRSPGPEGALHCTVFQGEIPYRLRRLGWLRARRTMPLSPR